MAKSCDLFKCLWKYTTLDGSTTSRAESPNATLILLTSGPKRLLRIVNNFMVSSYDFVSLPFCDASSITVPFRSCTSSCVAQITPLNKRGNRFTASFITASLWFISTISALTWRSFKEAIIFWTTVPSTDSLTCKTVLFSKQGRVKRKPRFASAESLILPSLSTFTNE